jgi:hypothetical protein
LVFSLLPLGNAQAQSNRSHYTSLEPKRCQTLRAKGAAGDYSAKCPGVAGYTLLVEEGDLRNNITVITPRGDKHSLELWQVVSTAFSTLGKQAEWRTSVQKGKLVPVSLIVRFIASEDAAVPNKTTSYLAVSKITSKAICVTDKISPGPQANEEARRAADNASDKPCLKTRE